MLGIGLLGSLWFPFTNPLWCSNVMLLFVEYDKRLFDLIFMNIEHIMQEEECYLCLFGYFTLLFIQVKEGRDKARFHKVLNFHFGRNRWELMKLNKMHKIAKIVIHVLLFISLKGGWLSWLLYLVYIWKRNRKKGKVAWLRVGENIHWRVDLISEILNDVHQLRTLHKL